MVEPLFFTTLPTEIQIGQSLSLSGAEAKHAISVRRIRIGEAIALGDGKTKKVHGLVSSVKNDSLELKVSSIEHLSPPVVELTLVQALAKGDRDELAIQAATELGVSEVLPWQADRSVAVWKAEKVDKGRARWQSIVLEAAKQSLQGRIPEVSSPRSTKDLVEALKGHNLVLVLDPTAKDSIVEIELPAAGSIAVVVGPEGGLSEAEISQFQARGFKLCHLGKGILRTSTAGLAAISYLKSALGEWD